MHPNEFLQQLDDTRISAAIHAAEANTTGEIRVFISRHRIDEGAAVLEAQRHFTRLKMHLTTDRNAVLIFVAPEDQQFAIVGDVAVHEQCGQSFWETLAAEMGANFKQGDFTGGLIHVIGTAGRLLAEHFPASGPHPNQLSDDVLHD